MTNPLAVFATEELARAGLSPAAIAALRRLPADITPDETVAAHEADEDLAALVAEMWDDPDRFLDALGRGEALGLHMVAMDEDEAARRLESEGSMTSFAAVGDADAFRALLERPIEDWMVYLHPSQAWPVNLGIDGPVRVRGGAGTGKTVVGLHRARRLAEREGASVLLTTFVSNLPTVWQGLFATFAPEVRGRIDMRTVDSLAMAVYREGGGDCVPAEETQVGAIVDRLHEEARGRIGGLSAYQLRQELDFILTGRGISDAGEYMSLARTGRGSRLPAAAREAVWGLYERYRRSLARDGRMDWHILRREALDLLRDGAVTRRYDAVVVDEAQDLTETAVRLLIEVAGGAGAPRLTIVGDGEQSIYPGGFSLRSLGVDVRGRSRVLRVNWRNTYTIWLAAKAFLGDTAFDDLEDDEADHRDPEDAGADPATAASRAFTSSQAARTRRPNGSPPSWRRTSSGAWTPATARCWCPPTGARRRSSGPCRSRACPSPRSCRTRGCTGRERVGRHVPPRQGTGVQERLRGRPVPGRLAARPARPRPRVRARAPRHGGPGGVRGDDPGPRSARGRRRRHAGGGTRRRSMGVRSVGVRMGLMELRSVWAAHRETWLAEDESTANRERVLRDDLLPLIVMQRRGELTPEEFRFRSDILSKTEKHWGFQGGGQMFLNILVKDAAGLGRDDELAGEARSGTCPAQR